VVVLPAEAPIEATGAGDERSMSRIALAAAGISSFRWFGVKASVIVFVTNVIV